MFYYFGISINFFLLFILLSKREKIMADKILAAWLFAIGIHTILFVITLQPVSVENIHLTMGVLAPFPLIHGPFLYLYTAASTNMFRSKKRVWLLHFLPFVGTILFLIPLYLKSGKEKMDIYMNGGEFYRTINFIIVLLIQISGVVYIVWSFVLLRKHKKNIGQQFSYEEKINLNWLRYLIYGMLVIWIIIILLKKSVLIFGGGVVFVILLGFFGIRQAGIFNTNSLPQPKPAGTNESTDENLYPEAQAKEGFAESVIKHSVAALPVLAAGTSAEPARKKYASSGLSREMSETIHEKLSNIMASEKLYTEPELSLSVLAAKLGIHPNYLSQVINEKEGKSFFDYINILRVEEFKRLAALSGSEQYTIIGLAYDCGFNSKSSFNKNFRKVTGQSPSEYLAGIAGKS
jgi:AraC-like DNA-binding protein